MSVSDGEAHLLVVDDDERLGQLLKRYLGDAGFRVTVAGDAAAARGQLAAFHFDLLIVDVMMPGETGLSLVADLRRTSRVPVLMLTAMGEPSDRIAGLEAGADDYLAKPFEPRELLLRIGAVLRRAHSVPTEARSLRFGPFEFDPKRGELTRDGQPVALTSGEAMLLRLFAANPGATISRADLAQKTGGGEGRAIDVQITRLRRKIEDEPKNPRYLQTVWGEGYVLWAD
jgi:two-component system phosphate regulon response regulator OmpR